MKIYLSHALADAPLASQLAQRLQAEGFQVWLAQNEIFPGDNWAEKVLQALNECQAMVVLWTPAAVQSSHVQWDISFAMGSIAYRHRLIPILVGHEVELLLRELPWILKRFRIVRCPDPDQVAEAVHEVADALLAAA